MRQIGLIATVIALVAALVFLNNGIHKNAPLDHDDQTPPPAQSQKTAPTAAVAQSLHPEEALGDMAKSKYKITVGWTYDAANQADAKALNAALGAVREFARTNPKAVAVEIVNVDVPLQNRSAAAQAVKGVGVRINGSPVTYLTNNPGEGTTTVNYISHLLPYKTHLSH